MKFKKIALAAGIVMLTSCGPSYRVTDNSKVVNTIIPASVLSTFNTQYPIAAEVVWTPYDGNAAQIVDWDLSGWPVLANGDYAANFKMSEDSYYAWYDANGNWIGSAYAVSDYHKLPSTVNSLITDKFPGYTIVSVNSELKKDITNYEITLQNAGTKVKIVADSNGNIVKQKSIS